MLTLNMPDIMDELEVIAEQLDAAVGETRAANDRLEQLLASIGRCPTLTHYSLRLSDVLSTTSSAPDSILSVVERLRASIRRHGNAGQQQTTETSVV